VERLKWMNEQMEAIYRRCHEDVKPFIVAKSRIHDTAAPRYLIHASDGKMEMIDDGLTPEARETIKKIDESIEDILRRCKLDIEELIWPRKLG